MDINFIEKELNRIDSDKFMSAENKKMNIRILNFAALQFKDEQKSQELLNNISIIIDELKQDPNSKFAGLNSTIDLNSVDLRNEIIDIVDERVFDGNKDYEPNSMDEVKLLIESCNVEKAKKLFELYENFNEYEKKQAIMFARALNATEGIINDNLYSEYNKVLIVSTQKDEKGNATGVYHYIPKDKVKFSTDYYKALEELLTALKNQRLAPVTYQFLINMTNLIFAKYTNGTILTKEKLEDINNNKLK